MSMQVSNAREAIGFWHRSEKPSSRYIPFRQHGQLKDRHETQTNKKEKEGLAQSVERLTTERNVAGSILGAREILKVLKNNWEMKALHAFALQISSG